MVRIRLAKTKDRKRVSELYFLLNDDIPKSSLSFRNKFKDFIFVSEDKGRIIGFISGFFLRIF